MSDQRIERSEPTQPAHTMASGADRSIATWLALCVFVFFAGLTHGHFETSDEWNVFEATTSLWHGCVRSLPSDTNR